MKRISFFIAAGLLALGMCASANAQYVWVDKNNVKHYSDKPPPSDVPNNRILKSPRNRPAKNISETTPGADAASASNGAKPAASQSAPMTAAERNADFKKRKIEQAAKDKKAEQEKSNADAKAQNCERAKEYQRTLNSGQRIGRSGKSGEREYMSDEERNNESRTVQEALKDCN